MRTPQEPSCGAAQKEVGFLGLQLKSCTALLGCLSGMSSSTYLKLATLSSPLLNSPPLLVSPWQNMAPSAFSCPDHCYLFFPLVSPPIHHQQLFILPPKRDFFFHQFYQCFSSPGVLRWPSQSPCLSVSSLQVHPSNCPQTQLPKMQTEPGHFYTIL